MDQCDKNPAPPFLQSPQLSFSVQSKTHIPIFFSWQKRKLFLLSDSPLHFAGKPYAPLQHIKSLETWVSDIFFLIAFFLSLFSTLSLSLFLIPSFPLIIFSKLCNQPGSPFCGPPQCSCVQLIQMLHQRSPSNHQELKGEKLFEEHLPSRSCSNRVGFGFWVLQRLLGYFLEIIIEKKIKKSIISFIGGLSQKILSQYF